MAVAAGRLVDGEHPDLGLVGAAEGGRTGFRAGARRNVAGDRAVRGGRPMERCRRGRESGRRAGLGVGAATEEAAVPVEPASVSSPTRVGFYRVGAADRYVGGPR